MADNTNSNSNSNTESSPQLAEDTTVFFDVSVGGEALGSIIFSLFSSSVPKTCENFRSLCTGESGCGKSTGCPLSFKGSSFHRIIPGFMLQGGDFSNSDGTGGESIYGGSFDDEPSGLKLIHDRPFLLSMANSGPNTNGSQFFITTVPTPHLNGKHAVFGEVLKGFDIVRYLEATPTGESDKPKEPCVITDCGQLTTVEALTEKLQYDKEDNLPRYPLDHFSPKDEDFKKKCFEAAIKLKEMGSSHLKSGNADKALEKYTKARNYCIAGGPEKKLGEREDAKDAVKDDEERDHYETVLVPILLNRALAALKAEDLNSVEQDTTWILEAEPLCMGATARNEVTRTKALFRRASARYKRKAYDGAQVDINAAIKLDEADKALAKMSKQISEAVKLQKEKEKKKYSKMFS